MNDDQLDQALRAARPHTAADEGWAAYADGDGALATIRQRACAAESKRVRPALLRRPRVLGLATGIAAATAAAITIGLMTPGGPPESPPQAVPPPRTNGRVGPVPAHMELASYNSCDAMLAGLRRHLAAHIGPYGLTYPYDYYKSLDLIHGPVAAPSGLTALGSAAGDALPEHSTTNVQEAGVGEPDIVDTDGSRVVSVSNGVLRVVDAQTHKITGTLDLSVYAGSDNAHLLMAGDRVLVLLSNVPRSYYLGGLVSGDTGGTTVLLVGLAGTPHIASTLHTDGDYLDARMVGDTARFVVQSTPTLAFPELRGEHSRSELIRHNRKIVRHAPLRAWLPTFQVTAHGTTTTRTVPCSSVRHPSYYSGRSMVTVYSVDLAGDDINPEPTAVVSDGTTLYASTTSLYIANTFGTKHQGRLTQLHRFDITGTGEPGYLGSNTIRGTPLNSYAMSEYDGTLRVVTTRHEWGSSATTGVYVLDDDTLKVQGHLDGLGRGEQVRAVRFLGPLAFVVTYKSIDPLFVLDLHDPVKPRTAGTLKVTGYSDYLHPVADGRLLGVGAAVSPHGSVNGLQVSLFDIAKPTHPRRLDVIVRKRAGSETGIDPHAFLYWPQTRIAVIPMDSWRSDESGAALVVHVGTDRLSVLGTIHNPAVSSTDGYETGIERTLVIGDALWTMSSSGLRVSDLHTLDRRAWVPFR